MISIIVPIYNTEKYIQRCIDSILAQTYTDFELLLINDGSTDNSGAKCDEYATKDLRIRVFHKENGGVSSARNLGLDNAKGEWITFVDSDDYIFENYLQNYANNINDNVDLICQGIEFDNYFSKAFPIKKCGIDYYGDVQNGMMELYKMPMPGSVWNKCFITKIIKERHLRFDKNITIHEDEHFVLTYLKYCKYMISSKDIGYFYFVPDWEKKYNATTNYYTIKKKIYSTQLILWGNSWNLILLGSLNELTASFISTFKMDRNKRNNILDYRKCAGENILKTEIFFLTKWLIYIDKTGYISTIVLKIHLLLKSLISSNKRR